MKKDKNLIGVIALALPGKPISDDEIVKSISHAVREKNISLKSARLKTLSRIAEWRRLNHFYS